MTEQISSKGICRECLKEFELKDEYLIQKGYFPIWGCPHCSYPNDSGDVGLFEIGENS